MGNSDSIFNEIMNMSVSKESFNGTKDNANTVKKLKPSEKLLKDILDLGYDMSQLEGVLKTKGNQLIISSAGSGKTTALIFKLIYDLKSGRSTIIQTINNNNIRVPDNIWVATFLKSGADELKSSYRKWCYKLHCADMSQVIQFSTLHAEYKRVLNMLGVETDIISDSDNKKLLKNVLKVYAVKSLRGVSLNDDEMSSLISALTRTRNRLDEKRYESDIYNELGLTSSVIDCILRDWKNERIIQNKVDFEDLQEILYNACYVDKDPDIINFISDRYNFVYLDEFQDISQIQYALLKIYCMNTKQVVAIGDDDQTIYSWRGSDNSIITKEFVKDFNPLKNDLSVNFRCPSNILNGIKPSIEKNTQRFAKSLSSAKDGGVLRVGNFSSYKQMATTLADLVYEDIKNGMSVAILCRVNSDGLLPALFFDKIGKFSFSISGSGMTLDSYIGRLAFSIIKLFTDSYSADVKRALSLLTWDKFGISKLMDICKNNHESIWSISEEDLVYSCIEIADKIISWRGMRESSGEIDALRLVLQDYRFNVFKKDTQFNDVMKSVLMSIESLLENYNYETVESFLVELEGINDRLKSREKLAKSQVKIATVHEFKGKEADSVYVWNDSTDVFPYIRSCNNIEDYEEERRVHYIACTRARKVSTVMYLSGKKGDFVNEMELSNSEKLTKQTSGVLNKKIKEEGEIEKSIDMFRELNEV